MAFAAVLTALGYYIILCRFCQGLLKIFLQGAATGGSFPPLPPATPRLWRTSLPFPPAGTAAAGRAGKAGGQLSRRGQRRQGKQATPEQAPRLAFSWQVLQVPQVVQCRGAGGGAPGEINFESPPSPPGKSALRARAGGIGGRSKAKVRVDRRQERQAPAALARPAPGERTISNAAVACDG